MANMDLTAAVRRLFVKNWLDMSKVRLQIAGATVIVRGRLMKARGDEPIGPMDIEHLEQAIRGTKGVKMLRWSLDDWVHERGEWRPAAE